MQNSSDRVSGSSAISLVHQAKRSITAFPGKDKIRQANATFVDNKRYITKHSAQEANV